MSLFNFTSSHPVGKFTDNIANQWNAAKGDPMAGNALGTQNDYARAGVTARDTGEKAVDEMKRINEQQMKATLDAAMNSFLLSMTQMLAKQITNGGKAIQNALA